MSDFLVVEGDRTPINLLLEDGDGPVDLSGASDLPFFRVDDTVISQLGASIPGIGFVNGYLLAHRQTSLGDHSVVIEAPVLDAVGYRFPSAGALGLKALPSTRKRTGDATWTPTQTDTQLLLTLTDSTGGVKDPLSPSRRLKVSGTSVAVDEAGYLEGWLHRAMAAQTRTVTWQFPANVVSNVDFGIYGLDRGVVTTWVKFTKTGTNALTASVRVAGTTYTDNVSDATNIQFDSAWKVQVKVNLTTDQVQILAGDTTPVALATPNITAGAKPSALVRDLDWVGVQGTVAVNDLLFTSITLADT